jgi:preprotein translocase subunit SecF
VTATVAEPSKSIFSRLYNGETAFDFVGHRRRWFALSGTIIIVGLLALGIKGLNFGIDFKGGTSWEVPAKGVSVTEARSAVAGVGVKDATVQTLKGANGTDIRVEAKVPPADQAKVTAALAKLTHQSENDIAVNSVGPTWGHEITHKALVALAAFFVAVGVFITLRFQAKMAFAALVAVFHDILITIGVYAIFGFDVTPNTVIALLTILGYSLYDTVVVFDKIDENTRGLAASGRMTYSDTVNLSMNQVLMRSINTSLVALLPILSVLLIGDLFLGATTLKEFGLALFVGLLSGAYSSIFIAAPILAILKEREPRYATIRQRLESRGTAGALLTPRAAAQQSASLGTSRTRTTAATAVLDDDDAGPDPPAVLTPSGDGQTEEGQPAPPASRSGQSRPPTSRPRPGPPRPPPRGRKKGGKRR